MAHSDNPYAHFDYSPYTNPEWLPVAFAYDTPEDEFRRFRSQQPDFFQRQVGLGDWDRRMQARYMLDAPEIANTGANPSYYQYLNQYRGGPDVAPLYRGSMGSYQDLVGLAQGAAAAGRTAPGAYMAAGDLTDPDEMNRRAWLSSQFAGEEAAANQMAVANLLALQRNRGAAAGTPRGAYTGQMGQAIRQAMNTLYQQRLNVGAPKETFLDWYLGATGQGA